MSWRDNLQRASFRDVPFLVDSVSSGFGRKTESHSYAQITTKENRSSGTIGTTRGTGDFAGIAYTFKPEPVTNVRPEYVWTQDLGPEADSFSIEAFVIQQKSNDYDYFSERDNLIKALKTPGPGNLIHPSFKDPIIVVLDGKSTVVENFTKEGGVAKFSLKFVQYNKPLFSNLQINRVAAVDVKAITVETSAANWISSAYDATKAFVGSIVANVTQMLNTIQGAVAATKALSSSIIALTTGILSAIISTIDAIIHLPQDLAAMAKSFHSSIRAMTGITDTQTVDIIERLLGIFLATNLANVSDVSATGYGSIIDSQTDNMAIFTYANQAMLIGDAARIAIRTDYQNYDEMYSTLLVILNATDNLMYRIGSLSLNNETLYKDLSNLRAALVEGMLNKYSDLAKPIQYLVPTGIESTLTLAYDRYDDIARSDEIINMNEILIKNPGFLPSGESLTILNE